jgi:hypothetical protein
MPSKRRDHYENVNAIRRVLVDQWNPIGVNVPDDEYDGYIPTIYRMMQELAGVEKLADHLGKLEWISMGLSPTPDLNRRVARLLVAILD